MELAGAAQGLARSAGMRVFAGVMKSDEDGQLELALEFAQVREQSGDLAGVIFLHPTQSDQGIQNQQPHCRRLPRAPRRSPCVNGLARPQCRLGLLLFPLPRVLVAPVPMDGYSLYRATLGLANFSASASCTGKMFHAIAPRMAVRFEQSPTAPVVGYGMRGNAQRFRLLSPWS